MRRITPFFICLVISAPVGAAQAPATAGRKQADAVEVPPGTIRVDGRLDEAAWSRAEAVADFVQKEPDEGAPPSDDTEVRFLYDNGALYIGARMFTRNAPAVQAPLSRRDDTDQAEKIVVALDTFFDHLTAVEFGVTASGVRLEQFYPSDDRERSDAGFDPVWEARVARDATSWTAELAIPFSQLRFSRQEQQVWGLEIRRFRPTLDEEDYWVLIPRTERVWASAFGELHGIAGIGPTRRIELLPYVAGGSTINSDRDPGNPFDDGRNLQGLSGADIKMGLGPNLTLNATVNPDFGQVEADPAEVNLTQFETRFTEKRPFFTEGSQLFSIGHPNFYYSRRVGGQATGPASGEFVDYPSATTILGAAKLTGRLPSRTSIGILSAVTDHETAHVAAPGTLAVSEVSVAPRAYWNVGRIQQEFGPLGSTVGLLVNTVHRDIAADDPLGDRLTNNAFSLAGDSVLRFKGGEYQLTSAGGISYLDGSAEAVERIQRGSSHYAQRPDKSYGPLDPTRTSLSGWSLITRLARVSGRHWLWTVSHKTDSVFFETNDIATLNSADGIQPSASVTYRETQPGRLFRGYEVGLNGSWEWTFGGERQNQQLRPSVNVTWNNFWTTSVSYSFISSAEDARLTRGGPLMEKPGGWALSATTRNRPTSQTRWSASLNLAGDDLDGFTRRVRGSFTFRPGPQWELSAAPNFEQETEPQQYVATLVGGGRPETYDNRYIFSRIDRSTMSTEFRMGFTLRPDMNIDVYAEPFAASGRYYDFGELTEPGAIDRITYGTAPDTSLATDGNGDRQVTVGTTHFTLTRRDFNTLSFRGNVVLRWEWQPGSTLYVVWQQSRGSTEVNGDYVDPRDMFRSIRAPGSNYFIVKTSFWLSVN